MEQVDSYVIEQTDGLGQVNEIKGRYVVLIAGLGDRWFDDRSETLFAWFCAKQGFKLGRSNAFCDLRQLIGAKYDY